MGGIFISYRREDSGPYAGRLRDALSNHFGAVQVFRDIDTINPGERFRRLIEQEVSSCDALLALIGPTWLAVTDDAGRRRLDDPNDYVRLEIATALDRDDVLVIPVLVGTTSMPAAAELPKPLASLADCQLARLSDEYWDEQVARLTRAIAKVVKPRAAPLPFHLTARVAALIAGAVVVALAAAAIYLTDGLGLWTRSGSGPIVKPVSVVKPVSATVFSPGGAPDNPQEVGLAIDGNPDTSWDTDTFHDPEPFPKFLEGEGLLLHLSEPTALSAVMIDLVSTGTAVQIRSSPTETPAKLADTTELTPITPLQPGHNRIAVNDRTQTSNVLVWITTLGTIKGESRTEISEVTLYAAG